MRRIGFIFAALLFVNMMFVPVESIMASDDIEWKGYDEGVSLAEVEEKNIFLYFYADWGGYCHKMDTSTFINSDVISYLNENFIAIKVNSDEEIKLASTYGVRGLPTTWFLKPNSDRISQMPGFIDADRLLCILKFVYSQSYETMDYQEFSDNCNDPGFNPEPESDACIILNSDFTLHFSNLNYDKTSFSMTFEYAGNYDFAPIWNTFASADLTAQSIEMKEDLSFDVPCVDVLGSLLSIQMIPNINFSKWTVKFE